MRGSSVTVDASRSSWSSASLAGELSDDAILDAVEAAVELTDSASSRTECKSGLSRTAPSKQ